MKHLSIALIATLIFLTGCGKKEEPAAVAAEAAAAPEAVQTAAKAPEAPAPAPVAKESSLPGLTSSLSSEAETIVEDLKQSVPEAAKAVASSVDWANLSWNDVATIPYEDKDQLLAWAAPQIDALKDQLTKAVMDKGVTGLASLGDTGWQGAVKTAVDALDTVRTSSPETWELARGVLVSAWQGLQAEASKLL